MFTGKGTARGNHVAHCNKKVKRAYKVNLHWKRLWSESKQRLVRYRISQSALRTVDKYGLDAVIDKLRAKGELI